MTAHDTIFAPATAPMKSGVAILRVSGPDALKTLALLGVSEPPSPRLATLVSLRHPDTGDVIDQALALYFPNPASFTGEDILELHLHGSRAVMASLLLLLSKQSNFRLADPGEFSRRAFMNGKMDLTQAEGLADLIDSETSAQANQALRQMHGRMSQEFEDIRSQIINQLALLEAYIDFPDEEIPPSTWQEVLNKVSALRARIAGLLADGHRGERVREGIEIVILGPTNAGKSSLLNALAKREIAIVSDTPGTTRDVLEVHLDLGGYPVTLLDTAGLRQSTESIENEGIKRAKSRAEHAELKLFVFDITTNPESFPEILAMYDNNSLMIFSKNDLKNRPINKEYLAISVKSGKGVTELLDKLTHMVSSRYERVGESLITRERHRICLVDCLTHLDRINHSNPLEINGEELRMAARCIAKITGKIAVDDILDVVFSTFCIGK